MVASRAVLPHVPLDATASRGASRARHPDATGEVVRDGVRVVWDRYGPAVPEPGRRTILLTPTWSIVHSRLWKAQIPFLARHFRVVTWDGRGNGRSDRPASTEAYAQAEFAADGLAVLDATGTDRAVVVGLSAGASWTLMLAARHPERVDGAIFIAPALPIGRRRADAGNGHGEFDAVRDRYEGWEQYNRHAWRRDYPRFLEFFFGRCFTESHSTKPIEDCVGWGGETDAETLIRTQDARRLAEHEEVVALARAVRCPALVIHGTDDDVRPYDEGVALAGLLGASLLTLERSGHIPPAREPVRTNLAIRDFVRALPPARAGGDGVPR